MAAPIADRNSVEMTAAGEKAVPDNQSLLKLLTPLMTRPAVGATHVINVIEIHKDALVSHLTAPAAVKDCENVRPYFPTGRREAPTYRVLDTLARGVPGLMLDWISANHVVENKQVFREFYALNANYFNFPDPSSFPGKKYDNRTGKAPEACVKPAGPYGNAKQPLKDQQARMEDMIDDLFFPSPLLLFNNGTGLRLSAWHRLATPPEGIAKWEKDYEAAATAGGGAVVSGISLLYPGGKIPDPEHLGTNGDKGIPRIALAWNGGRPDYPLAIVSWHTALSAPQDGKLATGPTLKELAKVILALGYKEALNLDGSGSSQLIYGGADSKGPRAMVPLNIDNKFTFVDATPIPRPVPNGLLFYALQPK
jgi:hypothetical protein